MGLSFYIPTNTTFWDTFTGDDFTGENGSLPNSTIWELVDTTNLTIQDNKLNFNSNESSDEEFEIVSNFKLSGNFDIQIDIEPQTVTVPSVAYPYLLFFEIADAKTAPSFYSHILFRRTSAPIWQMGTQGTDSPWAANTVDAQSINPVRLTRTSGVVKAFYWNDTNGRFEWDGGTDGKTMGTNTDDMYVRLVGTQRANEELEVNYDDFVINSGTVVPPA